MKENGEKFDLISNIQRTKIMESSPITSWQIEGEKVKAVTISYSWALKSLGMLTADMKSEEDCLLAVKL